MREFIKNNFISILMIPFMILTCYGMINFKNGSKGCEVADKYVVVDFETPTYKNNMVALIIGMVGVLIMLIYPIILNFRKRF